MACYLFSEDDVVMRFIEKDWEMGDANGNGNDKFGTDARTRLGVAKGGK